MDKPLVPGKKYKLDANGNFIEEGQTATPPEQVPEDELPPDVVARKAAESKIDKMADAVEKLSAAVENKVNKETELQDPVVEVSDDDRFNFLKAILSNNPFKKSFKVLGGKISFTFKTLSTSELDAVSEALAIQSGRVPYASVLAMAGAHMRYAMTSAICDIEYKSDDGISKTVFKCIDSMYGEEPKKDFFYVRDTSGAMQKKEALLLPSPGQKVLWAAGEKFSNISVPLYNLLFEKYQKFDAVVTQLTKEAADPDFFQTGVGGR